MCADTGLELPLSINGFDPEALHAHAASVNTGVDAKPALAEGGEDLPWCTSQNQAECSKRPVGSTPSPVSIGTSPTAAATSLVTLPALSSNASDFAEYSSGGPRDAVRSKLERPPQ